MKNPPRDWYGMHRGDARKLDAFLGTYSSASRPLLTATITSPPYWGLKDYGHSKQIGHGQSYEQYLADSRAIFGTIFRHTREDGVLWLVVDTLYVPNGRRSRGQLEPLPFRLADEAATQGWILKEVIIWKKDKTLPWSGRGRLRNAFEYVLLLTKTDTFKYYIDRIRDPVELKQWWVQYPERYNPEGKVPTNVWEIPIPVQGSWSNSAIQHACPLPPDLVERALLLTTDLGDVVLDPFAGSGVVMAESERLGRLGVGIELVGRYVKAFETVVRPEVLQRRGRDELAERLQRSRRLQEAILKLRTVKYPRTLLKQLARIKPKPTIPLLAIVLGGRSDPAVLREPNKLIDATVLMVSDAPELERQELLRVLKDIANREPSSKFGIASNTYVIEPQDIKRFLKGHSLYYYPNGRTWMSERKVTLDEILVLANRRSRDKFVPIVSNIEVREKPRPGFS